MFNRTEKLSEYIRLYPVISLLLLLNIGLFLVRFIPEVGETIYYAGIGSNGLIAAGEWWRFITPMFLHANFMHILFNMFCLYVFAPELERFLGKMRFITLYFLSGLFANIATYFIHDWDYAHVGASGAIFGLFGAYGALIYYTKNQLPQLRQIILPIIFISVIMTFLQPNINVTGHLAGLAVGFLIGLSYFHPKRIVSWRPHKE